MIGLGQVLMDLWVVFAGLAWYNSNYYRFVLQKHMRFPAAAGLFFIFRSIFLVNNDSHIDNFKAAF
jgi:hypothetical protein